MIYVIMRGAVRVLAAVVLGRRLHLEGLERIPRRGSVLVVGNHVGTVDPVLLGIHIPRFDVYYMAKSELFRRRFVGWLFRRCHTFPVVRDSPDRNALRHALRHLELGRVLLVYPEGHRSPDGVIRHAHPGAGFIARHSAALIVPVASWGSDRVIPKGAWIPRRVDVHQRIGEPFHLPQLGADGRALTNQGAADLMMERVAELLPTARRPAA
ncbi:MAG: 1-acyl-sn-glycerol-3-phosphate acyltransferase [Candidatus Dormibacteraeota bacterium]|nr:1-acyl-sn-glycerol-3-phosphate acyltransferase [Candidatus Dormibacteraeota bacterium]